MAGNEKLLKHISDRYDYLNKCWEAARQERATDLRYLLGDPWEPKDRRAREAADRPCINHDELRQYVNQAINSVRQNRRGIKIDPESDGADNETALFRQDLVRTIEYNSNAQGVYITGYENALRGSYGFFRITRRYRGRTFDQEIVLKTILNPDSVLFDWDCAEADWGDAKDCFVLTQMKKEEFKRRFPQAEIKDFTSEHRLAAPNWIREDDVLVAEYWRVESTYQPIYLTIQGEVVGWKPDKIFIADEREYEKKQVVQHITNGIEILKRTEQPGEILPIIPVIGEEIWVDEGAGAVRKLLSLTRLARHPQMSLAYLVSQEMEEAGLSPKVPWIGYKGQFDSSREAWETSHKVPYSILEIDPIVDGVAGQVLPPPSHQQFTPNFGAYEIAKDACRRAIQSAMGITSLPTAMQRDSQKSGVALERIQQAQAVGSFHFVDNYDRALRLAGRVIDSWIPATYPREMPMNLRKPDDTYRPVMINTPEPYVEREGEPPQQYLTDKGTHQVTISTGPSFQSQMDEVKDFLNTLMSNLGNLPVAPPQAAKILSILIQMKNMGPRGDELAEIISPPEKKEAQPPPEMMQMIQQLQAQLQAIDAYAKQKEAELVELRQQIKARVIDNEYKREIEQMKIEADLAKAEITTTAQNLLERVALIERVLEQSQAPASPQPLA